MIPLGVHGTNVSASLRLASFPAFAEWKLC